ncbi:hypothetical protein [Neisseria dentiae]|uniref:hypothetical protein n=1 Tax=Neisseria dentiae TaxID=194197 RepID=UPI0035A1889E
MSKFKFGDNVEHSRYGLGVVTLTKEGCIDVYVEYKNSQYGFWTPEEDLKLIHPPGIVSNILEWFERAVPNPTIKHKMMQLGCHFEEIKEMCQSMNLYSDEPSIHELRFKSKFMPYRNEIEGMDDVQSLEILDSLCDQIVTALGVGYMMGFDMAAALDEVNQSNWSKFENGEPVFSEQGKIIKGKNYFKPNLREFLSQKAV